MILLHGIYELGQWTNRVYGPPYSYTPSRYNYHNEIQPSYNPPQGSFYFNANYQLTPPNNLFQSPIQKNTPQLSVQSISNHDNLLKLIHQCVHLLISILFLHYDIAHINTHINNTVYYVFSAHHSNGHVWS